MCQSWPVVSVHAIMLSLRAWVRACLSVCVCCIVGAWVCVCVCVCVALCVGKRGVTSSSCTRSCSCSRLSTSASSSVEVVCAADATSCMEDVRSAAPGRQGGQWWTMGGLLRVGVVLSPHLSLHAAWRPALPL